MKKIILYSVLILSGASLYGCKKFLETLPDNRIDLDNPANITVDKVAELLVNAYPKANYMAFCESMSDNAEDKLGGSVTLSNYAPYEYVDVNNNMSQDMPSSYWTEAYKAVALANQALTAISKVSNPKDYSAQRGEALVTRAYAHFMLVNLFAKSYNPSTASSDMGVPYVTAPETTVFGQYDRKTVADTYNAIEQDLLEGLPLISDDTYTVPKYHFTKAAANAFATRFYLYKKQYDKAVLYAGKVFPSGNFAANMRPWLTTYQKATYYDLQLMYAAPTEKANLLLVECMSNWGNNFPFYRFGLSSSILQTIYRKNVAGGGMAYLIYGTSLALNIPKFYPHFVQTGLNANTGYYFNTIPLFTTEEVLLNRAEAYAYLGNYTAALADLNTFASQRVYNGLDSLGNMRPYDPVANSITPASLTTYYSSNNTQSNIVNAVLDYKRAEFLFEGMRWFDVLRYNIQVTHKYADSTTVLKPDDLRRVLQIPNAATLSGLPLNPR